MTKSDIGTAFIKRLSKAVLDSEAIKHPYLSAMRGESFYDQELVLKDFAFQYGLYNSNFIHYMTVVSSNLKNPMHKQILQSNLEEEKGLVNDVELAPEVLSSIAGVSHAHLYRSFQEAVGVKTISHGAEHEQPGDIWSRSFLELCEMNELVGIGAIGIGTEFIVSRIYKQILDGLKSHSNLTAIERVFFDLHSVCDDNHAEQILLIVEDLAKDDYSCRQIEYGVNKAIELRVSFWNKMLERSLNFATDAILVN